MKNKFLILSTLVSVLFCYSCWDIAKTENEINILNPDRHENKTYKSYHSSNRTIRKHEKEELEFSEFWRQEAFREAKSFISGFLVKDDCDPLGFIYYHPRHVSYIGNNGFEVNMYATYDCNQNYNNEARFVINSFYLGNGLWDSELIEQRLTH